MRSIKLKHMSTWNESRRELARSYRELLGAVQTNIITPYEPSWSKAVYHLHVVQVEKREAVQTELAKENIRTGIHYPVPLHLQKAYSNLGCGHGDFPLCEKAAERILSLPMFPGFSEADQARVVNAVARSAQCTEPQDVLAA